MKRIASENQSIASVFFQACRYYFPVLKAIFPFILLSVLLKNILLFLGVSPDNLGVRVTLILFMLLVQVYLWSVNLLSAESVLKRQPLSLNKACRIIYSKLVKIFLGLFAMIVASYILFYVGNLIYFLMTHFIQGQLLLRSIIAFTVIGLPLTVGLVLMLFVLPLIILENVSVLNAFRLSVVLIGYRYWFRAFLSYASIALLIIFLMPNTWHGHWLLQHHLSVVFDIVLVSLISPLIVNFMLLSLQAIERQPIL